MWNCAFCGTESLLPACSQVYQRVGLKKTLTEHATGRAISGGIFYKTNAFDQP